MIKRTKIYDGFCILEKVDIGQGWREVVTTNDSVCFLFYLPYEDKVLLVSQKREAAIGVSNPDGRITELCAGRFDLKIGVKGLVVKEAAEEVGVKITEEDVKLLNKGKSMMLSAGILTERSWLAFVEITNYQIDEEHVFGVDEGEHITRVWMSLKDFKRYVCQDVRVFAMREWFFGTYLRKMS